MKDECWSEKEVKGEKRGVKEEKRKVYIKINLPEYSKLEGWNYLRTL